MGAILRALVNPARWLDVWRYLLFRDGVPLPPPATVAVGLTPELAGRVTPATGPFDLSDRPGPGTEPGQFKDPIGVAVGDGRRHRRRRQRQRPRAALRPRRHVPRHLGRGRRRRHVHPHRQRPRSDRDHGRSRRHHLGRRHLGTSRRRPRRQRARSCRPSAAETIDIGDDPARVDEAGGRFFGPRDIAVSDDAIYVVDTGNERVQLFTRDGAFVDAWGGYGSAPDQLIEPVGIALGPDGNVYVADSGNARISIFTPDGEPVAQWPVADWPAPAPGGLPPAFQPYLAFDAEGNLYATASNAGQVLIFDGEGAMTGSGNGRRRRAAGAAGRGRRRAGRGRALHRRRPRRGAGVHPASAAGSGSVGSRGRGGFAGTVTRSSRV